jgi:hypothetical protein
MRPQHGNNWAAQDCALHPEPLIAPGDAGGFDKRGIHRAKVTPDAPEGAADNDVANSAFIEKLNPHFH